MESIVTARLQLDMQAMRHNVVRMLSDREEEMKAAIESAITKAIANFDFDAIVREEVQRVISEGVKSAVAASCSRVMYEEPLSSIIDSAARAKVREAIERSLR